MTNKAPAFQFYASDYLADMKVELMTLEQEGAYIRLLAYCWREGSLPADADSLAKLCKGCSKGVITVVQRQFLSDPNDPTKLIHKRLEEERAKQKAYREQQSVAGKKSAQARSKSKDTQHPLEPALPRPLEQALNERSTLQSSSSTSSSTNELAGEVGEFSEAIKLVETPVEPAENKNNGLTPAVTGAGSLPDVVHEIYRHYPIKVQDDKALAAIQIALKEVGAAVLLEAVKAYAAEVKRTNTTHPTWPAKWFSENRWRAYVPVTDEPEQSESIRVENDQDFSTFPKETYENND